ncbi:phage terminase small subunit [Listeria seeligeri]|uniref:phage terminase small subunit n=1 Tax=Listeria seeligeri TaxID=1640 RepID=UPI0022EB72C2|nr:phage terminase small subunit [Listeria seeligeri]
MARKRDPRRIEAKNMWLESNGEMKLVEIAGKLGCSSNQIRKWKSTEKWSIDDEIENVPKSNSNVTNEKERYYKLKGNGNSIGNRGGAPPGNDNAIGNAGGGAPFKNKNALFTGEFETLSWEFMTEREQQLYESMDGNLVTHINQTIRELEIRKRRMMERIANIEKSMSDVEKSTLKQLRDKEYIGEKDGKKVRLYKQELVTVEEREKVTARIDRILSIENSLNNVTNQLIRAIKQQSDLEQAELKKELISSQTSMNREKLYKPDKVNKDSVANKPNFTEMSTEELRNYAASLRK